jgi:hypothetical protein
MMRPLPLLLVLGLILLALGVVAGRAGSSPFGSDIWKVRLDVSSSDRWLLLDVGRVRVEGRATPVFLLAHPEESGPGNHFDAMKVVGSQGGPSLWSYDGAGSDYVDASGSATGDASQVAARFCAAPSLEDVDGDGSDDVVFVEQDFILGRVLRAVRIEP